MRGRRGGPIVASSALKLRDLKRTFITPEGVDLRLELGSAGSRAAAFMIDLVLMIIILLAMTFGLLYLFSDTATVGGANGGGQFLAVLWLIGLFSLRNGWFALFEMGSRGATPGKFFFFKQKTAYEIGLGIPAEPLFRSERMTSKGRLSA